MRQCRRAVLGCRLRHRLDVVFDRLAAGVFVHGFARGLRRAARRAVALFPAEPEAREALGRFYLTSRPPRLDLAKAAFGEAARLSPKNALYPVFIAELLRSEGRGREIGAGGAGVIA